MRIKGCDYRTDLEEVEKDRVEWRAMIREALADGCHRRVENNETFIHGRDGTLLFEVYANIHAPVTP